MYQGNTISVTLKQGVATLVFSAEASVNTFGLSVVQEFSAALSALEQNRDITGLIICSAKDTFIVGADINEFGKVFAGGEQAIREHLQKNVDNFNRLQALPFVTVVAINGLALGGGFELALACDYRVAEPGAKLGLPETQLGIIPGWGGTVRLPRIGGVDTAIDWICSGKQKSAAAALTAGLVDALVAPEQLLAAAEHIVAESAAGRFDFYARREQKSEPLMLNKTEATLAFESAKGVVSATAGPHYPAPVYAINAMQEAAGQAQKAAEATELNYFVKAASTQAARALSGIFIADQVLSKKAKQWRKQAGAPVQQAGVVGAGIMGGGIACQSARKAVPVLLKDIDPKGIELGLAEAARLLQKQLQRGKLDSKAMAAALQRIDPTLHYADFNRADMVVEAVVENPKVKCAVLADIEAATSADTIIASNTSTISITHLAGALKRPENFCGMHFFNPVHAMPLVEVIRGKQTSEAAVARTVAYALALGKKPVVVNDCPGFLVNRVLFPYFAGFAMLVRDGVDYRHIDKVMENWGWPMGPAYLLDVVGLDTAVHAEKVMAEGFPERLSRDFTSALDTLFAAGMLGQKNARGFYRYQKDKKGKLQKQPNDEALRLLAQDKANTSLGDDEIIERMMVPMVTELVRCLAEGVVDSAHEADMAMVYGTGFPPFRGGVLHWVDTCGARAFCTMTERYQTLGPLYQPPAMLQTLAREQTTFTGQ